MEASIMKILKNETYFFILKNYHIKNLDLGGRTFGPLYHAWTLQLSLSTTSMNFFPGCFVIFFAHNNFFFVDVFECCL
jgi:hypothetical protein